MNRHCNSNDDEDSATTAIPKAEGRRGPRNVSRSSQLSRGKEFRTLLSVPQNKADGYSFGLARLFLLLHLPYEIARKIVAAFQLRVV